MLPLNRSRNRSRFFGLAVPQSSLDLDFLSGTLDPRITFTRASSGTFFGSNGLLQTAANDVPRFDYDPVTRAARGLLIEEQRTNLLTWSENFGDAAWTKVNTTVTVNSAVSPDGATTADTLVENTANATHFSQYLFTPVASTAYTFSCYVKAAGRTQTAISFTGGGAADAGVVFDLSTGAYLSTLGASPSAYSIRSIGNGWYHCSVTVVSVNTSAMAGRVYSVSSNAIVYTGDGTSGIYLWGAQLEDGAFPTSYIPTTSATTTRVADLASINTLTPWYNAIEGTFYSESAFVAPLTTNYFCRAFEISDTTSTERMTVLASSSLNRMRFAVVDGSLQSDLSDAAIPLVANSTYRTAASYKQDDFGFSVNGNTASTDTAGTVPTVTKLYLGVRFDGTSDFINGWLRRLVYWPVRVPNSQLQFITA